MVGRAVGERPVFQGGSLEANVHLQAALHDQACLTYRKTVLTALQEVENALALGGGWVEQ